MGQDKGLSWWRWRSRGARVIRGFLGRALKNVVSRVLANLGSPNTTVVRSGGDGRGDGRGGICWVLRSCRYDTRAGSDVDVVVCVILFIDGFDNIIAIFTDSPLVVRKLCLLILFLLFLSFGVWTALPKVQSLFFAVYLHSISGFSQSAPKIFNCALAENCETINLIKCMASSLIPKKQK